MANILEKIPDIYKCIVGFMDLLHVSAKVSTLSDQEQQLNCRVHDMTQQLKEQEARDLCMKRKQSLKHFFQRVDSFKAKVKQIQEKIGPLRKWKCIFVVHQVQCLLRVGQRLLDKGDQLQKEGLVRYEVFTRGLRFPIDVLIGDTANGLRHEALECIRRQCGIVGIHGNIGACKTTLMKLLYNDVYDDRNNYTAVFWAGAPKHKLDAMSIQNCLAEAMHFKFNDENVDRRSGLLEKRLKDMAPGHIVLFFDGLEEPFVPHEIGIPTGPDIAKSICCTLVFTARSEDVCNRMRATKIKMNLIHEDEARDLFLHESGLSSGTSTQDVVDNVVQQCAKMPLVITTIARSMRGKVEDCEWKNLLDELKGTIENTNGEETLILEQLKISFDCLGNTTIQNCFLASAKKLLEGIRLCSDKLIQHWIWEGLIGKKYWRGLGNHCKPTNDQGHTIINKLQRAYLLEVVEENGTQFVTMNTWIRKMAESILDSRSTKIEESMLGRDDGRKRNRSH